MAVCTDRKMVATADCLLPHVKSSRRCTEAVDNYLRRFLDNNEYRSACRSVAAVSGTSAGFWLGGAVPPCRLRQSKFGKFDYEMVHFEVYLNKYAVSIAPFSTPACPDCSRNIQKIALFS